jgi:hypothetical protein
VSSLADWEKEWLENPQRNGQPKLLPVDFLLPMVLTAQASQNDIERSENFANFMA